MDGAKPSGKDKQFFLAKQLLNVGYAANFPDKPTEQGAYLDVHRRGLRKVIWTDVHLIKRQTV
jgi:hypothetical protein